MKNSFHFWENSFSWGLPNQTMHRYLIPSNCYGVQSVCRFSDAVILDVYESLSLHVVKEIMELLFRHIDDF